MKRNPTKAVAYAGGHAGDKGFAAPPAGGERACRRFGSQGVREELNAGFHLIGM